MAGSWRGPERSGGKVIEFIGLIELTRLIELIGLIESIGLIELMVNRTQVIESVDRAVSFSI